MRNRAVLAGLLLALLPAAAQQPRPVIGERLQSLDLPRGVDLLGLAAAPRGSGPLWLLCAPGRLVRLEPPSPAARSIEPGALTGAHAISAAADGSKPAAPRAAACLDADKGLFLVLDTPPGAGSRLWWLDTLNNKSIPAALDAGGELRGLGLACLAGEIYISYDASKTQGPGPRARRGVAVFSWPDAPAGTPRLARHLPDSGQEPALALAFMELGGACYLWATSGEQWLYAADGPTGRGLFRLPSPHAPTPDARCAGLAFAGEDLWVAERAPGGSRLQRINAARNPFAPVAGPRHMRRLAMSIETRPEADLPKMGKVFHYYSRPYDTPQLPNQGLWLPTEKTVDVSSDPGAQVRRFFHDPAGDRQARQWMALVEYRDGPPRTHASRYEIDLWTRPWRTFVYPHLADRDAGAPAYLADDKLLYDLEDRGTYERFIARVKAYINESYGVPADMDNPYWAARNIVEYIQDHYYYPVREVGMPAAVDYARGHYDANPGNLKIALSERPYDKSQIIACSGTSVMLAGALRHLGIPARWLGTGLQQAPRVWDRNANGLLDEGEAAPCTNGHRLNQVWLGRGYGWTCFDATPSRPANDDFDPPPPVQTQARFMERSAAGVGADMRIVFNVGSEHFKPLFREFRFDERLAKNNDCGGDQRYNLQGRFEEPALWKLPRHRIEVRNLCFAADVALEGRGTNTRIAWKLSGPWDREDRVSIWLQRRAGKKDRFEDAALLGSGVPASAGRLDADLSRFKGPAWRILLRKDGDRVTGGCSAVFAL